MASEIVLAVQTEKGIAVREATLPTPKTFNKSSQSLEMFFVWHGDDQLHEKERAFTEIIKAEQRNH